MKDQKGYAQRPFDNQDKIVLYACIAALVLLALIL